MNAYLLISTIEQMTPDERRRFGEALEKCGVSFVKRLEHPRLGSANRSGDVHKTSDNTALIIEMIEMKINERR